MEIPHTEKEHQLPYCPCRGDIELQNQTPVIWLSNDAVLHVPGANLEGISDCFDLCAPQNGSPQGNVAMSTQPRQ